MIAQDVQMAMQEIFNRIYPIDSIYISVDKNFNPEAAFGGKWSKMQGGYALMTVNGGAGDMSTTDPSDHIPGEACQGGVPNITGEFTAYQFGQWGSDLTKSGCFNSSKQSSKTGTTDQGSKAVDLLFNASLSSSSYGMYQRGANNHVVADHIGVVAWRRTALGGGWLTKLVKRFLSCFKAERRCCVC